MKLASVPFGDPVTVGVPVFVVNATVTHSVSRKPTVFERMVLRLSRRAQQNQAVGDASLREAFEEHLGVQGVPRLLEATASGLVRLDVLRSEAPAGASLLDQPLHTLRLTPLGESYYNETTLPSKQTDDAVEYFYEPWSNSLSPGPSCQLTDQTPALVFDAGLFKPRDPSSMVDREIRENRPRFLKKNSKIIDTCAEVSEPVGWLALEIELHASPEGYLELKIRDETYERWLGGLEPSIVEQTFLDGIIGRATTPQLELPRKIIAQAKGLTIASMPGAVTRPAIELSGMRNGRLAIDLSPADGPAVITTPTEGLAVISCPAPATVPPQLASLKIDGGRPAGCRVVGDLTLAWSGGVRCVGVCADLEGEHAGEFWQQFSDDLAATLACSTDPRIATAPFNWGSDRPIESLSRRLEGLTAAQALEKIGEFLAAIAQTGLTLAAGQQQTLTGSLTASIDATADDPSLEIARVDALVRLAGASLGADAPVGELTRSLLAKTRPPVSALEIRQLLALAPNPESIPARLLVPEALAAVLDGLWNDPSQPLATDSVGDLHVLERYRCAQAALDASLGREHAQLAATQQRVTAAGSVGKALQTAEDWLAVVEDPALARATGHAFPHGLVELRESVRGWRDAAKANLAPALGTGVTALVFDSNTLMDYPDALRRLTGSQVAVVPNTVLDELDRLKRSSEDDTADKKARAAKARAANRTIDDLREGGSLRFEPGHTELISPDFGSTGHPDNQILSVAIAYSSSHVILVTGDKNLRNKAQASGIEATGWRDVQTDRGDK